MTAMAMTTVNEDLMEQYRQALLHYAAIEGEIGSTARMVLAGAEPFRTDGPYLISYSVERVLSYNPAFGNDRLCECGDPYDRHFDSYEDMYPCGCKYCGCREFRCEAA
jgi:hypothetical protein